MAYLRKLFDTSGKSAALFHHRAICKTARDTARSGAAAELPSLRDATIPCCAEPRVAEADGRIKTISRPHPSLHSLDCIGRRGVEADSRVRGVDVNEIEYR